MPAPERERSRESSLHIDVWPALRISDQRKARTAGIRLRSISTAGTNAVILLRSASSPRSISNTSNFVLDRFSKGEAKREEFLKISAKRFGRK